MFLVGNCGLKRVTDLLTICDSELLKAMARLHWHGGKASRRPGRMPYPLVPYCVSGYDTQIIGDKGCEICQLYVEILTLVILSLTELTCTFADIYAVV